MIKPDISIILPVFNGFDLAPLAIESILNQNFENFELIISDDNSKDNTLEVISAFNDPRITIYSQKKGLGQFGNFNFLLEKANAPLVKCFSQDDIMLPNLLSEVFAFHQKNPELGLSYCGSSDINEFGTITNPWKEDKTPAVLSFELYAKFSLAFGCLAGSNSQITINRGLIGKDYYFNEGLSHSGDFELWTRIAKKYAVGFLNKELCQIRSHSNQVTHSPNSTFNSIMENVPIIEELFTRVNFPKKVEDKIRIELIYVYYFNSVMKLVSLRKLHAATKGYKMLAAYCSMADLFIFWLKTKLLGNDFFQKRKRELTDLIFENQ